MDVESSSRIRSAFPFRICLLGILACCSCSNNDRPLYPVRGSVTYNGLPASKAMVVFHPVNESETSGVKPRAIVTRDGTFQAFTFSAGDGVPAGDYVVTVAGEKHAKKGKAGAPVEKKNESSARILPPQYENPKSTPLRVTIQKGDNDLPPFQLKAK